MDGLGRRAFKSKGQSDQRPGSVDPRSRESDKEGGWGTDPKVKQTEKAIPTRANDFDLVKGVVTSEMIALSIPNRIIIRFRGREELGEWFKGR
jgi:hypothetical protein